MKLIKKIKQKYKILLISLLLIPLIMIMSFIIIILGYELIFKLNLKFDFINLIKQNSQNLLLILISLIIGIIFYFLYAYVALFKDQKSKTKIIDTKQTDYGSSNWLSSKQFNQNYPLFYLQNPSNLHGFVTSSKQKNKKTIVNLRANTHVLVTGGTGSGKTQCLVIPTIQVNAYSKIKPTLIITDPKGELFETQSLLLQQQGYEIQTINLRNPLNSSQWNPLATIYNQWIEVLTLNFKKINHYDDKEFKNLQCHYHHQFACEYCFEDLKIPYLSYKNIYYANNKDLEITINNEIVLLKTRIQEDLRDLCKTLFSSNDKDKFWDLSAANLVKAIILAMLEDIEQIILNNNCSNLQEVEIILNQEFPLKKFNLTSVAIIATEKEKMKKWLVARNFDSAAKVAANIILNSAEATLGSILATLSTGLEIFTDQGIQKLISNNNIDFNQVTIKPTAIFIIVPDERIERHIFATLFISQLYKALIAKANNLANQKLERPVYFLCDEFGNIPAIVNMDSIITVARSRWIHFMLIIQDIKQLENKYGKETANVIFSNCSMHIFLQTMDLQTAKTYSEIIGEKTVLQVSASSDSLNRNSSISEQLKGHRLISPDDLMRLPENEAIIIYSKENPVKTKLLPWWKSKSYLKGKMITNQNKNHGFEQTNDNIYNIANSYFYEDNRFHKKSNQKKELEKMISNLISMLKKIEIYSKKDVTLKFQKDNIHKQLQTIISEQII